MVVDFAIKRFSGCRVASITYVGRYRGENMLRDEFSKIMEWAKEKNLKTGRWFFLEPASEGVPDGKRKWEACIEIKDKARSGKGIRIRQLPEQLVATVKFDPEKVAARLVYHGLEGWLGWRKKSKEYRWAGAPREVYIGDPWKSARAWANVEVQVPVKKMS